MYKKIGLSFLFLFLAVSMACAAPYTITIENGDQAKVRNVIVMHCLEIGYTLKDSNDFQLVLEKPVETFIGNVLLADSRSGKYPVFRFIWTTLSAAEDKTQVVLDYYLVSAPGTEREIQRDRGTSQTIVNYVNQQLYAVKALAEGKDRDELLKEAGLLEPATSPEEPPAISSGIKLEGNTIASIEDDGLAHGAGLIPGDVILEINGRSATESLLEKMDESLASGRSVMLLFERAGEQDIATLKP